MVVQKWCFFATFLNSTFELFVSIANLTKNRHYGRFCKSWLRGMISLTRQLRSFPFVKTSGNRHTSVWLSLVVNHLASVIQPSKLLKQKIHHDGCIFYFNWLRGMDLNHRPSGYEPDELPDCSIPR